ncbi:hypothetical protein LTR06_011269 [Exophiala xenobiotica]|nr:hypothetical protein LTR06_011269 [Exophiala xenobiotica]
MSSPSSRNSLFVEAATRNASSSVAAHRSTPVANEPVIHDQFDKKTGSWQYVVADPTSQSAVIIDPVLDYDSPTGTISTTNADQLLLLVKDNGYRVDMILETHAHADHMTAASYLQKRLSEEQGIDRPLIGIGKRIRQVQEMFGERYGIPPAEYQGAFDKLFDDDEVFHVGNMEAQAIHIPGHTPDHMGYRIGDNVFVGDSVFHIDVGSARADFPGGSADALFNSGRKLFELPDHTRIWIGHDYPPPGRDAPVSSMTVQDHKKQNKHLKDTISEQAFVDLRKQRDAMLSEPKLIHTSLQVNIRAGQLPKPTESGHRMLHIPMRLPEGKEW